MYKDFEKKCIDEQIQYDNAISRKNFPFVQRHDFMFRVFSLVMGEDRFGAFGGRVTVSSVDWWGGMKREGEGAE